MRIDRGLQRSQQHVRPDIAGDEIHLVGLHEFFGFLLADVRLLLIVLVDHLDRLAAHLAAEMIERELERIAHVVADHRGRAAEGRDKPDLDAVPRRGGCPWREGRPPPPPANRSQIQIPPSSLLKAPPLTEARTPPLITP